MKKYNYYLKNLGLFLTSELFIVLIISLLNLFGVNSSITTILLLILNILLFAFFGFNHGIIANKKGYIIGLFNAFVLLFILVLINLLFFKGEFNINSVLYYLMLTTSSTLGAMIGKSKKKEDN